MIEGDPCHRASKAAREEPSNLEGIINISADDNNFEKSMYWYCLALSLILPYEFRSLTARSNWHLISGSTIKPHICTSRKRGDESFSSFWLRFSRASRKTSAPLRKLWDRAHKVKVLGELLDWVRSMGETAWAWYAKPEILWYSILLPPYGAMMGLLVDWWHKLVNDGLGKRT